MQRRHRTFLVWVAAQGVLGGAFVFGAGGHAAVPEQHAGMLAPVPDLVEAGLTLMVVMALELRRRRQR